MGATLITGAATPLAHKLKRRLAHNHIIMGDYLELPALMLSRGSMLKLPRPQQPSYAHSMLTLCLDNDITLVYPLQADEAVALLEARQLFTEYGITIMQTDEIQ